MEKIGEIELVNESPKIWAKQHDLRILKKSCGECGILQTLDQPVKTNGYVGFIKRGCECGSTVVRCYFVPSSPEEVKFWDQVSKDLPMK